MHGVRTFLSFSGRFSFRACGWFFFFFFFKRSPDRIRLVQRVENIQRDKRKKKQKKNGSLHSAYQREYCWQACTVYQLRQIARLIGINGEKSAAGKEKWIYRPRESNFRRAIVDRKLPSYNEIAQDSGCPIRNLSVWLGIELLKFQWLILARMGSRKNGKLWP